MSPEHCESQGKLYIVTVMVINSRPDYRGHYHYIGNVLMKFRTKENNQIYLKLRIANI